MNDVPPSATRFDGVAEAYARYRPSYPPAAIALLLEGLPDPADVVDVGAGTGIASRLLVEAGARVIAIEPNLEMRQYAQAAGFDARAGTADDTGLAAGSADLITAFQAFHWFANDRALAEFTRVLRPRGRFAAIWNERDADDPFGRDLIALDRAYGETQMIATFDYPEDGTQAVLRRNGFGNVRHATFSNPQRIDEDGLIGRQRSLSFAPRAGAALDDYLAETRALFARYRGSDGFASLRLRTDVYVGDLPQ